MFSEMDFEASRSFLNQYPRHLASDLTGMTAPFTSQWGCWPDLLECEKGTISHLLMFSWRNFSLANVFTIVTWSSTKLGDVTTVWLSFTCRKPPAQKLLINRPIPELWSFESRGSITIAEIGQGRAQSLAWLLFQQDRFLKGLPRPITLYMTHFHTNSWWFSNTCHSLQDHRVFSEVQGSQRLFVGRYRHMYTLLPPLRYLVITSWVAKIASAQDTLILPVWLLQIWSGCPCLQGLRKRPT